MLPAIALLTVVLALAFWNGANDVSKGVATLVGSGVTRLRTAVAWGAIWTGAGGLAATFVATGLMKAFSGGGLIPEIPDGHTMLLAVGAGAMMWVAFATRMALPVSTTHAIIGALLGAGIAAVGSGGIAWHVLATKFAAPLLLSPLASLALVITITPVTHFVFGGLQRHCVCVERDVIAAATLSGAVAFSAASQIVAGTVASCDASPTTVLRLNLMDGLHWLTAGATSFARGLNDAPKILGLGVAASAATGVTPGFAFALVALAMVAGSLVAGFHVTTTLADRVTRMTPGEGFAANLVASVLVILASRFALPVSTTHVSSGAIIGLGLKRGGGSIHWKTVRDMFGAWLITLPVTAVISAVCYRMLVAII